MSVRALFPLQAVMECWRSSLERAHAKAMIVLVVGGQVDGTATKRLDMRVFAATGGGPDPPNAHPVRGQQKAIRPAPGHLPKGPVREDPAHRSGALTPPAEGVPEPPQAINRHRGKESRSTPRWTPPPDPVHPVDAVNAAGAD